MVTVDTAENVADDKVISEAVTDSHRFTSFKSRVEAKRTGVRPSIGHTRHSIREMVCGASETTP